MTAPHETDEFRNAATYTVAVTYTVAGGTRVETAHRRARRVAERVAAATARLGVVVEASAVAGTPGTHGELVAQQRVAFAGANTGTAPAGKPNLLSSYIDPEHERTLVSLAEANRRARERREADAARRRAVGCPNAYRTRLVDDVACKCVYCQPGRHLDLLTDPTATQVWTPRCICSQHVEEPGQRCTTHINTEIVVLDDDPPELQHLEELHSEVTPVTTQTPNYEDHYTDVPSDLQKQPHRLAPGDAHPRRDGSGDASGGGDR
ncbi:hypothetical protein [Salsipaludibacter albus]|uniref:hypothetical protein n=1 Tax=Salsipaludibacter albus TaxID=2849650 RepID=UPI001EE4793C|nr:hypothetical protein [Salsipaludibacter albus]MBY5161484.1 hypothetical protein [Salsipaludibacter albus]